MLNKLIYTHAINRLAKMYSDKEHYIHQKPPRHQGKQTKQYKKQLIAKCSKPWMAPSHRWAPHRSGHQCGACGVRVHQALTVHLNEECPQLSIEDQLPAPEKPHQPMPKKMTRTQVIKHLLHQQQEEKPPQQQHELEETAGYLRCVRCGTNVHKRSNEQTFQAFVQGQCLDQPYNQDHAGHSSDALWQKGNKVTCTQCGITLHLDGQQRLIHTAAVKKPCKGSGSASSTPLTEIFKKQLEQASQHGSPDSSGDNSQQTPQESQAMHDQVKRPRLDTKGTTQSIQVEQHRPTPRRLHFPTDLDLQEQGTKTDTIAQAMKPSHLAAPVPNNSSSHRAQDTVAEATSQTRQADTAALAMTPSHEAASARALRSSPPADMTQEATGSPKGNSSPAQDRQDDEEDHGQILE